MLVIKCAILLGIGVAAFAMVILCVTGTVFLVALLASKLLDIISRLHTVVFGHNKTNKTK